VVTCRQPEVALTSGLGSSEQAARIATGELANRGWPRLASLVGGRIASFGDTCWQTDARLGESIRRPDGRPYHVESIARVRRQLRDQGVITSERVYPNGELPTQAKYRHSTRGTTIKTFNWRHISQKNPFSRRARKQKRIEEAKKARELGDIVRASPRYASAPAIVDQPNYKPRPVEIPPEIARLAAEAQAAQKLRETRRAAAQHRRAVEASASVPPHPHPPPL
jgi:hypothetical protein